MDQNPAFPRARERVSEWSEQRERSQRMSERCERTNEQLIEWLNTLYYASIP